MEAKIPIPDRLFLLSAKYYLACADLDKFPARMKGIEGKARRILQ
jgi:hypothetical protein